MLNNASPRFLDIGHPQSGLAHCLGVLRYYIFQLLRAISESWVPRGSQSDGRYLKSRERLSTQRYYQYQVPYTPPQVPQSPVSLLGGTGNLQPRFWNLEWRIRLRFQQIKCDNNLEWQLIAVYHQVRLSSHLLMYQTSLFSLSAG